MDKKVILSTNSYEIYYDAENDTVKTDSYDNIAIRMVDYYNELRKRDINKFLNMMKMTTNDLDKDVLIGKIEQYFQNVRYVSTKLIYVVENVYQYDKLFVSVLNKFPELDKKSVLRGFTVHVSLYEDLKKLTIMVIADNIILDKKIQKTLEYGLDHEINLSSLRSDKLYNIYNMLLKHCGKHYINKENQHHTRTVDYRQIEF